MRETGRESEGDKVRKRREGEKEKEEKSKRENHVINIGKSKMKTWRIEITLVAFFLIQAPPPP